MAKASAKDDAHLKEKEKILRFSALLVLKTDEGTNHIVDASEDDGGELGPVSPLRDERQGERVHKQLITHSQIIAKTQSMFYLHFFLLHLSKNLCK